MTPPPDKQRDVAPATLGRRSSRVAVAIPISLSGRDASGRAFKEFSRTTVLNKHGAMLSTFHDLPLGTEVEVENRALGRKAKAHVVWLGEKRGPKDPVEIGVQLVTPENIWGVELPPDDWQDGPPLPPTARVEKRPAPATPSAPANPAEPLPFAARAQAVQPPPSTGSETLRAPETPASPPAPRVLTAAQELEEKLKAALKQIQQAGEDLARQLEGQLRARCDETIAGAASDLTARALEKICRESEDLLKDFRSRLEQAALEVEKKSLEVMQTRIQEVTLAHLEESAAELDKRTAENLELFIEQLKEKREKFLGETTTPPRQSPAAEPGSNPPDS
jgi:HPt (histidine-containing phosphotransfer) domain-containing protein